MAPTLLAPSVGYTVVFRAGRSHPNYRGGSTAMAPEDVGKVRDGGVWGGVAADMDVLELMQAVAAGAHTYTTPPGRAAIPPSGASGGGASAGGTDMPQDQIDMGFKDVDGSISGFPDFNDPVFNGQNPFGLGRVHGTSYPRGVDAKGRTIFHLRNWLLFPPRLNAVNSINDTVPGKGVLDFRERAVAHAARRGQPRSLSISNEPWRPPASSGQQKPS